MDDKKRLNEIAKAAGIVCDHMLDLLKKTDDTAIQLLATEVIYVGGYIQGLCGQQFDREGEE